MGKREANYFKKARRSWKKKKLSCELKCGAILESSLPTPFADEEPSCSSSASKIDISFKSEDLEIDNDDHYIITNFSIIKRIISTVGKCPECCSDINITNDFNGKLGFANKLVIKCELCEWKSTFFTSVLMKKESKSTRGHARYDVNARSVFAFREIGKGYQAIRDFAMHMNMVPPYNAKAYNSINDMIHDAYEEAAESSMKKTSDDVRALLNYADDQTADIEVSLDGTWQKRGYASLNGVTTVIAKTNEKCIDKHVG